MKNKSTKQDKSKNKFPYINPTGKGGFQDHPELRSDGRWDKNNSFTYWMNWFKQLSVEEFANYEKEKPDSKRTVSESLAYARVYNARNKLSEFQEVANRTEGMPNQPFSGNVNFGDNDEIFDELYEKNPDETIRQIIEAGNTFLANKSKKNTKDGKPMPK